MDYYHAEKLDEFVKAVDDGTWDDVANGAFIVLPDESIWARVSPGGADHDALYDLVVERHLERRGVHAEAAPIHDIFVCLSMFRPDRMYCGECGWFDGRRENVIPIR